MGIKGARASQEETIAAATRKRSEMESLRLAEEKQKREKRIVDAERAEMASQMQAMRAERDKAQLEARQVLYTIESSGTVVEVAGLVEGTSAEDVKVRNFVRPFRRASSLTIYTRLRLRRTERSCTVRSRNPSIVL